MALDVKVGQFQIQAAVATQSITSVGFTPKVIFFWSIASEIVAGESERFGRFNFGVSDATTHRAFALNSGRDFEPVTGLPRTNTSRRLSTDALLAPSGGGGPGSLNSFWAFTVSAMTGTGFDIAYSVQAVANHEDFVYFMALGGTDLTNWDIGEFDGEVGTPRQFITGVGFKPDLLMVFGGGTDTALGGDTGLVQDAEMTFGMATTDNQYVSSLKALDTQLISRTKSAFREELVTLFSADTNVVTTQASLVTMDDDGFTLDWLKASQAFRYFYIALKGPRFRIGIDQTPTRATSHPVPGIGFAPKGLFTVANGVLPTLPSGVSDISFSFGGSDDNECYTISYVDPNGRIPETANRAVDTVAVILKTAQDIPKARANIDEFGKRDFTLNWTQADPPLLRYCYIVLGDTNDPAGAVITNGNVSELTEVGAEIADDIEVATLVWSNMAAAGHKLILGESDTLGDSANRLIELSSKLAKETIEIDLRDSRFANGLQVTQLDSGDVFLYLLPRARQTPLSVLVTATGDTILVAAPGAGLSIYVTDIQAILDGSGNNTVGFREGIGGTYRWQGRIGAEDSNRMTFTPEWKLPTNTALVVNVANANPDMYFNLQYFVAT